MQRRRWLILASMLVGFVLCLLAGAGTIAYPMIYDGRIYPGVSVWGIDLGGLTVAQAVARLAEGLPDPAQQTLTLRLGDEAWSFSWADAGKGYDYHQTALAAYQVARADRLMYKQTLPAWRLRQGGQEVELVDVPADPDRVAAKLAQIAPQVVTPAADAELHIGPEGVTSKPARSGRQLDLAASAARVRQALAVDGTGPVELAVVQIRPRLTDLEPARGQAQALLEEPFVLVADDPLTDYYAEFSAPPEQVAAWLEAVTQEGPSGPQVILDLQGGAIYGWLQEVAAQVGAGRILDPDELLPQVILALRAGQHQVRPRVRHPQGTYVVQPGDAFFDIAYYFGFPQWQLEAANPDVDPEGLEVGMALTIPSIDVLVPEPVVPGKRIEIDLPAQRLRAYQDGELVYDLTCSSGISDTPTIAGQFQVLFKEDVAYAPRWDLDMPYFLAIYEHAEGFYNGIHELPILSSGQRLWGGVLGWPASYGCIILDIGDAETIYNWAPVGTLVSIEGVAPEIPKEEEAAEP